LRCVQTDADLAQAKAFSLAWTGKIEAFISSRGFDLETSQEWPTQIDSIARIQFDYILPGHGRVQYDRRDMIGSRNYVEKSTERVIAGKKAGQSVAELRQTVTAPVFEVAPGRNLRACFDARRD
jgi:hypothetical protein